MFRTLILGLFIAANLMIKGAPAGAQATHPIVVIAFDLSSSTPLQTDEAFPAQVAQRLAKVIANQPLGTHVLVRSFQTFGAERFRRDIQLTRNARPQQVAQALAELTLTLPGMMKEQRIEIGNSTDMLGFLSSQTAAFDDGCEAQDVTFIFVGDGLQNSAEANAYHAVRGTDDAAFPASPGLAGCNVEIWGAARGSGMTASQVQRLIEVWQAWAEASGVKSIRILHDW